MSFPRSFGRESRRRPRGGGEPGPLMKTHCVYILCSRRNGTLYVGMTSDLIKRVYERKNGMVDGFTKKHGVALSCMA